MERAVVKAVYRLDCDAIGYHGENNPIVQDLTHGRVVCLFGLDIDPSKDSVENEHEDTGGDSHVEPEECVLREVVGCLSDGGVRKGLALFIFDDAHIVGVAWCKDDDGHVDEYNPVESEGSV